MKLLPPQVRLRELFDYHEDGHFVRRVARHPRTGCRVGDRVPAASWVPAGPYDYAKVTVDGKRYTLHRLIYQWHHGWCPDIVDHYPDRDITNCRIENLREASHSESNLNRGLHADNTTGLPGVTDRGGKYEVRPMRDGMRYHLGVYDTLEIAAGVLREFELVEVKELPKAPAG
jgi:hypothetical protein